MKVSQGGKHMKSRQISAVMILIVALAFLLIVIGFFTGAQAFSTLERLSVSQEPYQEMLDEVQTIAVQAMACGGMVVIGIGILMISVLHLFRSTERMRKEAAALQEKNLAMENLIQKTQRLAHHQRLETLGTLTSSIAHEFNNLLTPMMGYSLMALEKLQPEEELYDDILEIYQSSRRAKEIISRLSDLSRKNTANTFRLVSIDELVRKTLDVAMPAKPETVEVNLNLNCWDQRLYANEIQMSQLLLNLILNGFQAMQSKPGTLTVSTSYNEDSIRLEVTDTGCGIPKEMQCKIFEPFFTTKESGKGTGLGLAIAAQVVEDHRGKIKVFSKEGEGTTMKVTIPRHRKEELS